MTPQGWTGIIAGLGLIAFSWKAVDAFRRYDDARYTEAGIKYLTTMYPELRRG